MKITFIMPGVGKKENEPYVKSWKMEPLALAVLAGLTPKNIEVEFFDDRLDSISYETKTDLVAINAETYTAKRCYHIASEFRKRGKVVLLGGYHPSLVPEESSQYADSIVVGEAESLWNEIIQDFQSNNLKKQYISNGRSNLESIFPKRNIYNNKNYLPVTLIETARGCKFSCDFCSIASFFNSQYVSRPISDVIDEIKMFRKKTIFFVDDNIATDFDRAKELFNALIPLKIKWFGQGDINIANDPELLRLMKKSGCLGLLMGFESLNKNNLKKMGKLWTREQCDYEISIKKIHEHGISIYATFIFGYDYDTVDSFDEALEFALKHRFLLAAFNHLVPFPGTSLYSTLLREGRLFYDKWWLEPKYRFGDLAFYPKLMSPKELSEGCMKTRRKFYSYGSILKRGFNSKAINNLYMIAIYLSQNFFAQQEVQKRQGLPLGQGLD